MPSSPDDYIIHFGSASSGPSGEYFLIKKYGGADAFKVDDVGAAAVGGKFACDSALNIQTTSSASLYIAEFRGGSPLRRLLAVRQSGLTEVPGMLILRHSATSTPPTGAGNGTVYWHEPSGAWKLSIRVGGTLRDLPTV